MEDDQNLIYVNMDGRQISIDEDLEIFNQNSNATISAKNNDDDNKNSTMEQYVDEENEDGFNIDDKKYCTGGKITR